MQYLKHLHKVLLNAIATDEATGAVDLMAQSREHTVYVEWSALTTAGVVVIETAPHKDYSGTWSNLTTFTWAAASSIDAFRTTGAYGAIRARITTAIAGGTVTVTIFAN